MDRIKGDTGSGLFSRVASLFVRKGRDNGKKRKSIRTTTAAIIAVTLLGLIFLLYILSYVSLDSGFSSLEERLTGDNVMRAANAVNAEVDRLDSIANAWATSEELPEFIDSGDTSVARTIFSDGRLVDVGVNILLITDSEGNILWHKYMNLDYGHQMPTPKSLLSQIAGHEDVLSNGTTKGTLMLNSGPMLIASRPITDQASGDLFGNLLVGRYLDRNEVSSLSTTTQLDISVIENKSGFEEYFEIFKNEGTVAGTNESPIVISPVDNDYVAGFSEIYDIYGEPVAVLQVTEPRDVTIYGKGVLSLLIMMLVLASVIFGAVILVLIQRSVVSRLENLNREIKTVAMTESPEGRINIEGDDEISSVGSAINMMLESIEKGKEQYSRLFDSANDLIFTIDADGAFVSANGAMEKKTGLEDGGLAGRKIEEFVRNGGMGKIRPLLSGNGMGIGGKTEITLVSTSGEEYLVEFSAQPLTDSDEMTGFFVIARDVTAKRKAEEELKNHRNRLRELVTERTAQLEHANSELVKEVEERIRFEESLAEEKERLSVTLSSIAEGVIATDHLGYVTLINREASSKIGISVDSAGGKRIDSIFRLEKAGRPEDIGSIVLDVISDRKVFEINTEVDLFDSEGNAYPVVLSVSPLTDRSGASIGAVIVFREISERLRWEEEVLRRQKLESLGVLAGGIAHDFNNILTAISGNIGLARNMAEGDADVSSRLEEAEKAISRAKDITRQLITFSKGGEPVRQVQDIKSMIRESAEFVSHGSNVKLYFDIADDLSNVEVDKGQISQVIENLVINSIQAMADGGNIYVQAKNAGVISGKDGLEDGKYIVISVRDNGSGIPEEYREKIFDPYFTTKKSGNGLGLASCMSIIRKHGGAVKLISEVGVGTEFRIYLPATGKSVDAEDGLSGGMLSGSSRVLVMDDDRSIYDTIPQLLRGYGFDVGAALDGAEAIRIYQQSKILKKPIDVFVMDLTVPGGLGGVETIALLREFDPDILAIVSSGYSNDPVMADFREYGFDAVLPKPYNIENLVRLINRLVSEKEKKDKIG
jgi:PAS domain S-box-containing protein